MDALNTVPEMITNRKSLKTQKRKVFSSWRNVDIDEAALTEDCSYSITVVLDQHILSLLYIGPN